MKTKRETDARSSETALSRPERDAPHAVALNAAEGRVLSEALRRGEDTRNVMEDALVSYGRWILGNVFNDKASEALKDRADNRVWSTLLERAGGPTLRLNRKMLFVAVHIAARDKRITDEAWRNLEPGRKQLLLPLGDDDLMRDAAQHVTAMKLSQRATQDYVTSLREAQGAAPRTRMTAPRLTSQLKRFRAGVAKKSHRAQAERVLKDADATERAAIERELKAIRDWANELLRARR